MIHGILEDYLLTLISVTEHGRLSELEVMKMKGLAVYIREQMHTPFPAIVDEIFDAKKKYPEWPSNSAEQMNIITQELGDMAESMNEYSWLNRQPENTPGLDLDKEKVHEMVQRDCVQVAATAIRFLQYFNDVHSSSYKGDTQSQIE